MTRCRVFSMQLAAMALFTELLAGCPCGQATPLVAYHFEDDCADALCGFTIPAGQANRVIAIAPGEHALQLEPNTELDRVLSLPLAGASSALVLGYVARCETGTSLALTVTVSETRASDGGLATPSISARTAATSPTSDWARYDTQVVSTSTVPGGTLRTAAIIGLRIQSTGPGRCWVDDVELTTIRYSCS